MRKTYGIIVAATLFFIVFGASAGAKEMVSIEKVSEARAIALDIAEKATVLWDGTEEMDPMEFLKKINEFAETLEPYVVLIAETEAPKESKQYAAHVAIGLKSVELAMWYYLVGGLEGDSEELDVADYLLDMGRAQLEYSAEFLEE